MNKKPLALILSIITSLSITLEIGSGAFAFEKDPIEIVSKRSEYEKYFDNGDGTVTAIINTVPLHYLDNGEWLEIDNTLTLNESGNYINKSNSMNVTLSPITCAKSVSDIDNKQMMEIESDGYSMAWDFVNNSYQTTISNNLLTPISQISVNDDKKVNNISDNAKSNEITTKSLNKLESDVTYSSIYKSVDIDIAINSSSVNETIILNDHNSLPEKFTYYIEAKDLNAKIYEDNSIHFINVEGIEIFNIPVMFMYDSSEEPENNYNVGIDIEGYKDGYLLTIIPDKNWLLSDEINYPVMITHQVCKYTHVNSSYVSENDPDTNFVNDSLLVGGKSGFCNSAFLSIPDTFAGLGKNSDIIEASCNIFFSSNDHIGHNPNIHVGMMNYLPDKLTWNTTRNDSVYTPFYTIKIPEYSLGYYNIDITSIAHWLNYAQTNALAGAGSPTYGIKLSTLGGSNDRTLYAYSSRSSVHAPYFEIKYTSKPTYTFGFSPYKYNKKGTTNNFQNRMNCYSYALQTYYAGELSQGEYYKLYLSTSNLSIV
jgi:endoglucanase E